MDDGLVPGTLHAGTSPSESDQCEWPDDALCSVGISIVQLLHFRQAIVP